MFDPEFDPLDQLQTANKHILQQQKQIMQQAKNINELARAFNQRSEVIEKLVEVVNKQDLQINQLHDRLQILEIARQYETNKN
jgi:hypothetical protein